MLVNTPSIACAFVLVLGHFCSSPEKCHLIIDYLGDKKAIRKAYPNVKESVLNNYKNDSICGTWELLANAIYKGGHAALCGQGGQKEGQEKCMWATLISPHMDVSCNLSPSFHHLCHTIKNIIDAK